jgi:hypothetical protein
MLNKLEKPKYKHNKKRNTAFLFETLVKELTKAAVYGERTKQKVISNIIREHFSKKNVLGRELELYKQLYETSEFPKEIAEKFVSRVKEEHEKLNDTEIYNEQSKLIAKINKAVGHNIYDNFVPNYKTLATISQIFNRNVEPKRKILLEQELLGQITKKPLVENKETSVQENSVINRFIERFNEAYGETLLEEQKQLLNMYINSAEDQLELKLYINEELERIVTELDNANKSEEAQKVSEALKQLKFETVSEELIKKIMYAQQFVNEVKN